MILSLLQHIPASRRTSEGIKPHNTGVYFHKIPQDPFTGLSSIDYKEAEDRGYFKIDFLNVSAYQNVQNEEHLIKLMNTEPIWPLLCEKDICDQLLHVNGYHTVLSQLKPKTIEELAMFLALIRPGKKHLLNQVITQGWDSIKDEIWRKSAQGEYEFKKSHSLAYATMIVVQLNLLCEQLAG